MTPGEAVAALDAIERDANPIEWRANIEKAHVTADNILIRAVDASVADAYDRLIERCGDWWYA